MQLNKEQIDKLNLLLEPDNRDNRKAFRELFKDQIFVPRYNVSMHYERELALERLKKIVEQKIFSVLDFERNPKNIFASKMV